MEQPLPGVGNRRLASQNDGCTAPRKMAMETLTIVFQHLEGEAMNGHRHRWATLDIGVDLVWVLSKDVDKFSFSLIVLKNN